MLLPPLFVYRLTLLKGVQVLSALKQNSATLPANSEVLGLPRCGLACFSLLKRLFNFCRMSGF